MGSTLQGISLQHNDDDDDIVSLSLAESKAPSRPTRSGIASAIGTLYEVNVPTIKTSSPSSKASCQDINV